MKLNLNRIGAFFVGVGSAAAILAGASAANAATFNWSFDGLENTSGTFTENNGVIDSWSGTVGGTQISGLFATSNLWSHDNLIPLTYNGVGFIDTDGVYWNLFKDDYYYIYNYIFEDDSITVINGGNFSYSKAVPVPEPGATVPTAVVSLIALGALKSRNRIALKTSITNPVISVS